VIDGLSSDDTLGVVSGFNDQRIKVFSEKDKGIYDAMNKGIRKAQGKWIYFLGSDDVLMGNEVLATVAKACVNNTSTAVYGNVLIDGDALWAKDGDIYDGMFDLKKLLVKNICHQAIFYNRDIIEKKGISFDLTYPICADWDFNLHCWAAGSFTYFPVTIARFNAGGASTQKVIADNFGSDIIQKVIDYFHTDDYIKLKKILPKERFSQLGQLKKFAWRYKLDSLVSKFLPSL
jgi:glycosyltransferase involved in cell wall biosynthesis